MTNQSTSADHRQELKLRYGPDHVPATGPWNDVVSGLLSHRSVRRYDPRPLAADTLGTLIAAAQSAATSSNLQCWSVISVTDNGLRSELMEIAGDQKHIAQCPLFLVWLCDLSRNDRLGQARGLDLDALQLTESFLVGVVDAALAAQNAVVAAESLGLSTVYIGALRNDAKRVAELLKLPPGVVAVFGLCVGFASGHSEVKPRLPQEAVLFENHYGVDQETEIHQAYDQTLSDFSARNGMGELSWSQRVIDRLQHKALSGRAKLKSILEDLGLPLR